MQTSRMASNERQAQVHTPYSSVVISGEQERKVACNRRAEKARILHMWARGIFASHLDIDSRLKKSLFHLVHVGAKERV